MDSLILKLKIFKLSFKAMFGLLSTGHLLVQAFNGFFSLIKTGRQLLFATLKLINTSKAFCLKFGSPQLDFSLSFGKSFQGIRFLLNTLSQIFQFSVKILKLGKKSSSVTCF